MHTVLKKILQRLFRYFVRGLLFVAPVGLTVYVLYSAFLWLDGIIPLEYPGLGMLLILAGIMVVGLTFSTLLPQSFLNLIEQSVNHLPLVRLVYFSVKDLVSAFVGDKKKFNQPVLVTIEPQSGLKKIGFITQGDLSHLDMAGHLAVYFPHSYALSGEIFIVPQGAVQPIQASSAEVMKLIVSGGVSTKMGSERLKQEKELEY